MQKKIQNYIDIEWKIDSGFIKKTFIKIQCE